VSITDDRAGNWPDLQQWLVRMFASQTYILVVPTASLPLQEGKATKTSIRQRSQLYRDDPLWVMVGEELLSLMAV
jgi:hypothetical protein